MDWATNRPLDASKSCSAEKAAGRGTIAGHTAGAQGQGESLQLRRQELFEGVLGRAHGIGSGDLGRGVGRTVAESAGIFAPEVLRRQLDIEHEWCESENVPSGVGERVRRCPRAPFGAEGMAEATWIGMRHLAAAARMTEQRAQLFRVRDWVLAGSSPAKAKEIRNWKRTASRPQRYQRPRLTEIGRLTAQINTDKTH